MVPSMYFGLIRLVATAPPVLRLLSDLASYSLHTLHIQAVYVFFLF